MLTGSEIIKQVNNGNIVIEPFNIKNIGPNSCDLTLGNTLKVYRQIPSPYSGGISPLNPKIKNKTKEYSINESGFVLYPGKLYLGHTIERTGSEFYIPCIEGRSSVARLGITTHVAAGFGDLGFIGSWTLELHVIEPVVVYPDMRICQIHFFKPDGDISIKYKGKYNNCDGVVESRMYKDF